MVRITKKITLLVALLVVAFSLTGCGADETHATVSFTTDTGRAGLTRTFNGEGGLDTKGSLLALQNKYVIAFEEDETVTIAFNCEACGYEETVETAEAWAKLLSCECDGESGNKKEYAAVVVIAKEQLEKAEK